MAMTTPPTACAVVPSGIGTLNIMTRKLSAAKTARTGTLRVRTTRETRFEATYQVGTATAYPTAHVCGLRYPSGMCMHVLSPAAARTGARNGGQPSQLRTMCNRQGFSLAAGRREG